MLIDGEKEAKGATKESKVDLLIIGVGPAGLLAAAWAA